MERKGINFRVGIILTALIFIIVVFTVVLYKIQIAEGSDYVLQGSTYEHTETVSSSRGTIMDRYGRVLVSNRAGYNVSINEYVLLNADDVNGSVLSLITLCENNGIDYIDTLPISYEPYTYTFEESGKTYENYFRKYLSYKGWDSDITAENIMTLMKKTYRIGDGYTEEEARKIVGVRYELDLRHAVNMDAYTLAEDVNPDLLPAITENMIPGVEVNTVTYRQYNTTYAAHILGRVGLMNAEEYAVLKDNGYAMNARIGKDGLEQYCEQYLRGIDGLKKVTVTSEGKVVDEQYVTEPERGDHVVLTIDIMLQEVAERSLASCIDKLHQQGAIHGEGTDAEGGAVVAIEVKTGDILASASYPTYDLSTFNEDFSALNSDELKPLYNRALLAAYPPGSTYKMVTAAAALESGVITPLYEIEDKGRYTYYKDYQPVCNYFTNTGLTHGSINVMKALAVSCNYFFYEAGRLAGIDNIDEWAKAFGLGEATGVELYEETGTRANPETKLELTGEQWYGGNTLAAAIGQSDNAFTPLQLASYISALANRGTRYSTHFVKRVVSADYATVITETQPEVLGTVELSDMTFQTIFDGMHMTSTEGSASDYFKDYGVAVCSKTGTAQHGGGGSDNAAFVCFAPYEDPEIAVVVYIEKGAQGGVLAAVAKDMLDYYFSSKTSGETAVLENTLLS